jgi:hypothetical protein
MQGYADRPSVKAPNWHGLVVADILFNNLTTGLYVVAALGDVAAPAALAATASIAYPVALVLLLLDLACLVLDLGDPLRFHHMLRIFKIRSPMSVGTWSLVAFSLPVTALAGMTILRFGPGWLDLRYAIALVGLVPALAAAMYKGVLFSTTAQPGWRDARWLGAYLASSAVLLGCAEMLVLSLLLGEPAATALLRPATLALLLVNGIGLALLAADVRPLVPASLLSALVGFAVPMVLLGLNLGALALGAAAVLIVAGAFIVRRSLVHLPHAVVHPPTPAAADRDHR